MGMRDKLVKKPMIGNVSKPKPTTPAPQEPNKVEALPASNPKPSLLQLLEGKGRSLYGKGGMSHINNNTTNPAAGSLFGSTPNPTLQRPTNNNGAFNKLREAVLRNPSAFAGLKDRSSANPPANNMLSSLGSLTTSAKPNQPVQESAPIEAPSAPVQQPTNNSASISPQSQFQQTQQNLYQPTNSQPVQNEQPESMEPASQQMQAPPTEPTQPASQQMQSEQQAPEQDNSAIDAQIVQLQQQIAQLQAQKK